MIDRTCIGRKYFIKDYYGSKITVKVQDTVLLARDLVQYYEDALDTYVYAYRETTGTSVFLLKKFLTPLGIQRKLPEWW